MSEGRSLDTFQNPKSRARRFGISASSVTFSPMDYDSSFVVLSRWVDIVAACMAVGWVFFMRVGVPSGLGSIDSHGQRTAVFLRLRRVCKIVIYSAIVLFLL